MDTEQLNKVRKQISSLVWEYGKCCWENFEDDDGEQPDSFPVSVEIKSLIQPLIEQAKQEVASSVVLFLEGKCLIPKHRNYKYGRLDCHECIDDLIETIKSRYLGQLSRE